MLLEMKNFVLIILMLFILACESDESVTTDVQPELYFPPIGNESWERTDPATLGWDTGKIPELLQLLEAGNSRAFIVLKDGKIVLEHYWGKDLLSIQDFDATKNWYWASAAKTLKAFTVGQAEEQGLLNISDKTSDYLGEGWTSMPSDKESKITIWNQLTMTSGLETLVLGPGTLTPEKLRYKADAGERWAYHNPPYTLLTQVMEAATSSSYNDYFDSNLKDKIGMDGFWIWSNDNHLYLSTPRAMARFGNLILNKGKWEDDQLLNVNFVDQMITTSQDINLSYGYLWWLNGKASHMLPGFQIVFPGSPTPSAPADMFSAIGADGQYLCVVPSLNLVVVRMGENPDNSVVPVAFLEEIWTKLNIVLPND